MYPFSRHLNFLRHCAAGFFLAYSWPAVQAALGTVEVDLVFPQNDTYAPAHVMPVAFAFQNSELAGHLQPSIYFHISRYPDSNGTVAYNLFDLTWANWTSSDPFIQYGAAWEALDAEGIWLLVWELSVTSCSGSDGLNSTGHNTRSQMIFTTKKGAKAPDLTAATGGDMCSGVQNYTFEITDTRDSGKLLENGKPCAMLAETTPIPTPCAVTIEASAASSVSSSLTYIACAVQTEPASWCPEPEKDGGARGLVVPKLAVGGTTFLAVAVGGLAFFLR